MPAASADDSGVGKSTKFTIILIKLIYFTAIAVELKVELSLVVQDELTGSSINW